MQKLIKTTRTQLNLRNNFRTFFNLYDFYFPDLLDPFFVQLLVGTRFSIQCNIFGIHIECNRSFKDFDRALLYYEDFYTKILQRFIDERQISANNTDSVNVNKGTTSASKDSVSKGKEDLEESAVKNDLASGLQTRVGKNNTAQIDDLNVKHAAVSLANEESNTMNGKRLVIENSSAILKAIPNINDSFNENEESIRNNFKTVFNLLNLKNTSFEISYTKVKNGFKSVFCVNGQAYFGDLCETKKEAAESALTTFFETMHNKKRDTNTTGLSKEKKDTSIFELYNPLIKDITICDDIQSDDIYNLSLVKSNDLINTQNNTKNLNNMKLYDEVEIDSFDFYSFINNHCVNNRVNFPEYCIEKQNDVYICKAEYYNEKFTSKYFFDKEDAKKDVCRLIYNYIVKNHLRNAKNIKEMSNNIESKTRAVSKVHTLKNNRKDKNSEISEHSKKLIENMIDSDENDISGVSNDHKKKRKIGLKDL